MCATILVGGCSFEADYTGGALACTDGRCPSGLVCTANACVAGGDAGGPDAAMAALTCADPGVFTASGSVEGTTAGRGSTVSAQCGGFVMNGKDAVYSIPIAAGEDLLVAITGARKAYVIESCPATMCLGNAFASAGNPISVSPAAGTAFVIVDDENPSVAGAFTLTLTRN
ncbi:MAG: hypothetical protein ABI867_21785 [Kofleriaceae bacterium]